jgi:hypothetical protein
MIIAHPGPLVKSIDVIGIPNERWGETVKAADRAPTGKVLKHGLLAILLELKSLLVLGCLHVSW